MNCPPSPGAKGILWEALATVPGTQGCCSREENPMSGERILFPCLLRLCLLNSRGLWGEGGFNFQLHVLQASESIRIQFLLIID